MKTSLLPAAALERGATPWLFVAALATTLPHAGHLPIWLIAVAAALFIWGFFLWYRRQRLPGQWLLIPLVAAASVGIFLEYRTLFGRDAGVAMLVLFMALKLLELRARRDATIVVMLGYFLLLTHYFYSQSIPTGLWLIAALVLLTATLIRLFGGAASRPLASLRYAGLLVLQALPFMLVLYLLFPRVAGPLWGLPQDAFAGQTGLSDQMSPGSISQLIQNGEIAFRARFTGSLPKHQQLYWRGPVLESYDGQRWQQRALPGPTPRIESDTPPVRYSLTLEPHHQRWLLALDAPTGLPPEAALNPRLTLESKTPLNQRRVVALESALGYRFNRQEDATTLRRNLALPTGRNPQTQALATSWRQADNRPEAIVQRALSYFRQEPFAYTLVPPLLASPDPVDEFLFSSREGFCEHYASAFVVLMRAAGVPARVVTGYQGGELNPLDGNLVIRQSDAHAWAEVWLADQGWQRVDPTAAISPSRIETGIAAAARAGDPLPALVRLDNAWLRQLRYRWEAANNAWNLWVLGYNPSRQQELLTRLGLNPDWRQMAGLLALACGLLLLGTTAWTLYQRPRLDPAQRLWRKALRRLARLGIQAEPGETPQALGQRAGREIPALAETLAALATAYCQARYGNQATALDDLRAALKSLPRWRIR